MNRLLLALLASVSIAWGQKKEIPESFGIPVEYYTLKNGLKVVLSPDPTAPIATVAVYYNIGFRNEPKDPLCSEHPPSRRTERFPSVRSRGALPSLSAHFVN